MQNMGYLKYWKSYRNLGACLPKTLIGDGWHGGCQLVVLDQKIVRPLLLREPLHSPLTWGPADLDLEDIMRIVESAFARIFFMPHN